MKWFKHDSDANMDAKLQQVLLDYGLEGYGLYFYCLELIASSVEKHNLTFELEHDARIIARNTGSTVQKVEEMMTRFVGLSLFENTSGVITCLKMQNRTDEYTQKLIRQYNDNENNMLEHARTVSGQNPDSVGIKSVLIEENRREQKRTEENRTEEAQALPDGLNKTAWNEWIEFRRKCGFKKYKTDYTAKKMSVYSHDIQKKAIAYSMENEYQGLFPDKIKQQLPKTHKSHKLYKPDKPEIVDPEKAKAVIDMAKKSLRKIP